MQTYDCSHCPETFTDFTSAMNHAANEHGMTQREMLDEFKTHNKCHH